MNERHKINIGSIPNELDNLPFADRIKILASLAGKADSQCQVFGSESHKYKFNPIIDISRIKAFEQRTGLVLPEEYITYLTEVGNGGAGIDYGLYSIEKVEINYNKESITEGLTLFDYDEPAKVYYEKSLEMHLLENEKDDESVKKCNKLLSDILRGMLIIGTAGCTFDYFIMCKGSKKGYVGIFDCDLLPEEEASPVLFNMTFSKWLEDYFKRIILGKVTLNGFFYSVDRNTAI